MGSARVKKAGREKRKEIIKEEIAKHQECISQRNEEIGQAMKANDPKKLKGREKHLKCKEL